MVFDCIMPFFNYFRKCVLFSCIVFGLLSHSLLISIIILRHVLCFESVGFLNFMLTAFSCERVMCSLEK